MPEFAYIAQDESGTRQTGVMDAGTQTNVVDQIRARGWLVVSVQETQANADVGATDWTAILPFMGVRKVDIELALRQIAVMLRGGLTLLSSLNVLATNSPRASSRRLWRQVIEDIQAGETFSDALSNHKQIPIYVVRLTRVGEQTGVLDTVILQGADMIKSRRAAKRDVTTALAYPLIVFIVAMGVTAYLVLYVIPQLGKFLQGMGKDLPAMTQSLLTFADFFQLHGPAILVCLIALILGAIVTYLSQPGRLLVDRLALRIPIVGKVFRLAGTTTFAQSMGVLVRSGVTVIQSLQTIEQMHYNRHYAESVEHARENVINGNTLASSLANRHYMPLLPSMTAVAEQAGNLDDVMDEIATFHEEQLRLTIQTLSSWLVPVVVVVVGSVVGYVYIAFFLALFAVAS